MRNKNFGNFGPEQIIYFLLFLLPVIFLPLIYNSSEIAKTGLFRIIIEILVCIYYVPMIRGLSRAGPFAILVLAYFFWNIFTGALGVFWQASFFGTYFRQQGIITLAHFIALFLIVTSLGEKLDKRRLAIAIAAGSFLVSVWAICQVAMVLYGGNRPPEIAGPLGNPNFLGGYLVITLPFVWYVLTGPVLGKLFILFPAAAIVFSGSRTAIGLLLIMVGSYFLRKLRKKSVVIILFGALGILGILGVLGGGGRIGDIRERALTGFESSPNENRLRIWQKGLEAVSRRPVFGYGPENFEEAFSAAVVREKDIGLADIRVDKAHNEFLEVATASGLPGLGLYLLIIGMAGRLLWKKALAKENEIFWRVALASFFVFVIRSQFNPVSIAEQAIFWLLVGLAGQKESSKLPGLASARPRAGKAPRPPDLVSTTRSRTGRLGSAEGGQSSKLNKIIFLVLVCGMIFMVIFNLRLLVADSSFKKGLENEATNNPAAKVYFRKAAEIFPWEEEYRRY